MEQVSLPRVLFIDDQYSQAADLREELCDWLGVIEVPLDASPDALRRAASEPGATALATFCSAQRAGVNRVEVAEEAVAAGWPGAAGWRWALVLLDVRFDSNPPGPRDALFGMDVLEAFVRRWPDPDGGQGNTAVPVVMLSSTGRDASGEAANRRGALGYTEKRTLDRETFSRLLDVYGLLEDGSLIKRSDIRIFGRSLALLKALRRARRVAAVGARGNAMILGPQGAGKTSLAAYIHDHAWRGQTGQLVHYYASPTNPQVEYAALFGAWEGVYTDQRKDSYPGLAEQAHRGTLLIDEVHNLQPISQAELMEFGRLTAEGRRWVRRLGKAIPKTPREVHQRALRSVIGALDDEGSRIAVDLLLLSASSEPVDEEAWRAEQGFSDALFTRLAREYVGGVLRVPPLRARGEDIGPLFMRFLERRVRQLGAAWPKVIDAEALGVLADYAWPGNVAELQGVANYAADAAADFHTVHARHLPARISRRSPAPPSAAPPPLPATPRSAVVTLDDALDALRSAAVPDAPSQLAGRLDALQHAWGALVARALEQALEATRTFGAPGRSEGLDDLVPTRAVRLLLGRDRLTATQAATELLRLERYMPDDLPDDSHVARVMAWARARRRSTRDERP